MKRSFTSLLLATAVSAMALAAAPASAGGTLSVTFTPRNAEERAALAAGLIIYNLAQGGGRAVVTQRGSSNGAGIRQSGGRNLGAVHQEGTGHSGTLDQSGGGNVFGLFQFGRDTGASVVQTGGGSGLMLQYGW